MTRYSDLNERCTHDHRGGRQGEHSGWVWGAMGDLHIDTVMVGGGARGLKVGFLATLVTTIVFIKIPCCPHSYSHVPAVRMADHPRMIIITPKNLLMAYVFALCRRWELSHCYSQSLLPAYAYVCCSVQALAPPATVQPRPPIHLTLLPY